MDFPAAAPWSIEPVCDPACEDVCPAGALTSGWGCVAVGACWSLGNVDGVLGGLEDGDELDGCWAATNKEPLNISAQSASFDFIEASSSDLYLCRSTTEAGTLDGPENRAARASDSYCLLERVEKTAEKLFSCFAQWLDVE